MPKRKSVDSCDRIKRKIRKLERKLRRKRRSRSIVASSELEYSSRASSESSLPQRVERHIYGIENGNQANWTEDDAEPLEMTLLSEAQANSDLSIPGPSGSREKIPSVVTVPAPSACLPPPSLPQPPDTQLAAPDPASSACPAVAAPETEKLDEDLLEILGTDPTTDKKYGNEVNKDLSIRLQHWVTNGLNKELRSQLKERYLTPENCKLIDPPILNAEIKAAVSDVVIKRDKAIENKQKQLTLAMTSLSEAITLLMSSKERDTHLLKLLMDSARVIADCQHNDTITRRNFLLNSVKNDMKDHIQNTKVDSFLFGENLNEVLKSAKAINKTGTEMKLPAPKAANKKPNPNSFNTRNLNSKNPGPTRRRTGPPRMKEPATSSTRSRHTSSSRQSQRHPQRDRQNYRR